MCQNIKTAAILLYADKSLLKKYWKDKVIAYADKSLLKKYWKDKVIAYQENYENSKVHRIV